MLQGRSRIIIPHDVGLTILKGAVLFGLDPSIIKVRRSPAHLRRGRPEPFRRGEAPAGEDAYEGWYVLVHRRLRYVHLHWSVSGAGWNGKA